MYPHGVKDGFRFHPKSEECFHSPAQHSQHAHCGGSDGVASFFNRDDGVGTEEVGAATSLSPPISNGACERFDAIVHNEERTRRRLSTLPYTGFTQF